MQEVYLCLDVGGTEIKAGRWTRRGIFWRRFAIFPLWLEAIKKRFLKTLPIFFGRFARQEQRQWKSTWPFPAPSIMKTAFAD